MVNKERMFVILFGLLFGSSIVLIMEDIQSKLHLLHQPYTEGLAAFVSFMIMIPILEETIKKMIASFPIIINEKDRLIQSLFVGYGFQIGETMFYSSRESDYYIRLLLPMHFVFTFVSVRFNLTSGVLLHSIWNSQSFFSQGPLIQPSFIIIFYSIFILLIYIDRINNVIIDNSNRINNEGILH